MIPVSIILRRYDIIEKDLEYELTFTVNDAKTTIVCEPDYRFNPNAKTQIRCYNKHEVDNGILVPSWYRSIIHLLWNLPKTIDKIVVTRDGEVIKTFHNVENDIRIE